MPLIKGTTAKKMNICYWFKKLISIFSIFRFRKRKEEELLNQINTYNRSNLELLLNSYEFMAAVNKINEDKVKEDAYKIAKTIDTICGSVQKSEENRDAP